MTAKENQKAKLLKYTAINEAGNFNTWNPAHIEELKKEQFKKDLGQRVLFENEYLRIWEVVLLPKERLPFRKFESDYYWVAGSEGMVISRFSDGKIIFMHVEKGDSEYLKHEEKHAVYDMENVGQEILFFQLTEFKGEQFSTRQQIRERVDKKSTRDL